MSNNSGYTLVELISVIVIMVLIFSIVYPNYRAYQKHQQVIALGRELETNLRFAQSLAVTGAKPDGGACKNENKSFRGIQVQIINAQKYDFKSMCDNAPRLVPEKNFDLPSGVQIKHNIPGSRFTFKELGRGTDLTGTYYFGVCVGSDGYGLNLNPAGQITQNTTFTCP